MAVFYADSSVLVKRHVAEPGSMWMHRLCAPAAGHTIVVSRISTVEVISALNRRRREGSLSEAAYPVVRDDFLALCRRQYRLIRITHQLLSQTHALLERHPLRSYDALHLASALAAQDRLHAAALPALTFLAADDRLRTAAQAEGLAVDMPGDD